MAVSKALRGPPTSQRHSRCVQPPAARPASCQGFKANCAGHHAGLARTGRGSEPAGCARNDPLPWQNCLLPGAIENDSECKRSQMTLQVFPNFRMTIPNQLDVADQEEIVPDHGPKAMPGVRAPLSGCLACIRSLVLSFAKTATCSFCVAFFKSP